MKNSRSISRRRFLKSAAGAAVSAPLFIPGSAMGFGSVPPGDRIAMGFIGLGMQGPGLLRGFLDQPGTQVVAVCDADSRKLARGKAIAERYYSARSLPSGGIEAIRDFRNLLAKPGIDAVVIATPDHWHAVMAVTAMRSGKDVYCEKPLSLTIAEARAMANEARRTGRIFQTGSQQRSAQKFRHACELVRNGYIGEVRQVAVCIRTGFPPFPSFCNLPAAPVPDTINWDMWLGPAPWRPYHPDLPYPIEREGYPMWRNYYDYSGGGMTDWGAHHFDIAQWGLGMDHSGPVEIIPPDGGDIRHLTYRYTGGIEMTADFESNRVRFTGTEGWVEVNREYLKTFPENLVQRRIGPGEIRLYRSDDHQLDFLRSIRDRNRPVCDVETGCRSVTVCHLGNIAMRLGRPLKWDPVLERFNGDEEANRMTARAMRSPWRI
ncbi:Gfo/Idh/MocA family oxidoreductase [bacterium]|nr:Gfo/Idh/MocA family oxidoreductase [bacterium]